MITDSTGKATAAGTAPDKVGSGWTIQAHFAGSNLYLSQDSTVKSYNTLVHGTSLTLTISPNSVRVGGQYQVSGSLLDTITSAPINGKRISFTATSPISISDTLTDSSGKYLVGGITAPNNAGSHNIQAHFGADPLYKVSDSPVKALKVTAVGGATTTSSTQSLSISTKDMSSQDKSNILSNDYKSAQK